VLRTLEAIIFAYLRVILITVNMYEYELENARVSNDVQSWKGIYLDCPNIASALLVVFAPLDD